MKTILWIFFLTCLLACSLAKPQVPQYGPFTKDFQKWLEKQGEGGAYAAGMFDKYGATGSFGGKTFEDWMRQNYPVIFIHGNSDSALDTGNPFADGWTKTLETYLEDGYDFSELYGLSYGNRNISGALDAHMNCYDLLGHRQFVENVYAYTGSEKINVIGHSMGATIARKILKGGVVKLQHESCDLGQALTPIVDTFISISGAHYGFCLCQFMPHKNSCHYIEILVALESFNIVPQHRNSLAILQIMGNFSNRSTTIIRLKQDGEEIGAQGFDHQLLQTGNETEKRRQSIHGG